MIIADLSASELSILMTPFDLKRLESYANNMLDYHVILDLLPTVANLYFEKRLGAEVRLSAVQSSILLAIGLQRKTIEEVEGEHPFVPVTSGNCGGNLTVEISFPSFSLSFFVPIPATSQTELQLPVSQALALFTKIIRKISKRLIDIQKEAISATIPQAPSRDAAPLENNVDGKPAGATWKPVETSLEDELKEAGDEATKALKEKQREMIDSLDLSK